MFSLEECEIRFAKIQASRLAHEQAEADAAGITIWELRDRCQAASQRARDAEDEYHLRSAAERARIPSRYLMPSESMIATDAIQTVLAYSVALLILSGGVGCGKSFAAMIWMLLGGAKGLWVSAPELSRGCYDREAMDSLLDAPRLVIDDVGTEFADKSNRYVATLSEILETRFARRLRTIVTTNCSASAFRERYAGERLASRIAEDGAFVALGGPDLRRAGKAGGP